MPIESALQALRGAFAGSQLTEAQRSALGSAIAQLELAKCFRDGMDRARVEGGRRGLAQDNYQQAPDGYWEGWNCAIDWAFTYGGEQSHIGLPSPLGKL